MPRTRKKWLSESRKQKLIDEYVIASCSTNPPGLNGLAEGKLPNEIVTEARGKLQKVMPELQRVRQRAKLIENVADDIRYLIEELVRIKGLEELDTRPYRTGRRLNKIETEDDWSDI